LVVLPAFHPAIFDGNLPIGQTIYCLYLVPSLLTDHVLADLALACRAAPVDLAVSVLPVHVPQEDPAEIWEPPEVSELEVLSAVAEVLEEPPEVSELEVLSALAEAHEAPPEVSELEGLSALAEVHEELPVVLSELEPVRLSPVYPAPVSSEEPVPLELAAVQPGSADGLQVPWVDTYTDRD
jgi:hypothetical protein